MIKLKLPNLISGQCFLLYLILLALDSSAQTADWISPSFLDTIRNPVVLNTKTLEESKKIYLKTCWACHGENGEGDGPASVQLNPKPANHTLPVVQNQSDGALFWKISTGRGAMQPYSKVLTVQQRWELVHFIRSLKQKQ